jgi:hypothetical protein
VTTFRYQIYARDGEQWGSPYLDIGRALMRMWELNAFERANRFSLRPVRSRE